MVKMCWRQGLCLPEPAESLQSSVDRLARLRGGVRKRMGRKKGTGVKTKGERKGRWGKSKGNVSG